jgi:hypothetical protein
VPQFWKALLYGVFRMKIQLNRDELMIELGAAVQRFEALLRAVKPDDIEK